MSYHIEPCSVHSYLAGIVSELEPFYPSIQSNRYSPLVVQTLKGSMWCFWPLCSKRHLLLEMTSSMSISTSQDHCPMTISSSSPCFLLGSLDCCAWGSLSSLTAPLFTPYPRSHGDMMSTLMQPTSLLPSHSPRLMCSLKEIRL